MSLMNKQYRDFDVDLPPMEMLAVWNLLNCVGVTDLTSAQAVDEFVLRARAYETVLSARPIEEALLRAAVGTVVTGRAMSRAEFKKMLGELALERLAIRL